MTHEEWRRIKGIATEALEHPADDRARVVAAACAGDEALRRQVESLLQSAAAADHLFETPALNMPGAVGALEEAMDARPPIIGALIGPYRIVRELGHGGMGSVYLAERVDGEFEQQVAVKFVAGGISREALLRRFREERRILATLDHPNIARLFDGGTTADGSPYVVMEYVAGVPITDFCEQRHLNVRARIELIRRVCAAVQCAHQRLIIHRDVKATNILVTADGTPKLLDFGIATLAEPGLVPTSHTVLRAHTLESASPEQLRGELITVAVDIYALGLLLFHLLTGESPYGRKPASDAELIRAICEEMPSAPSAVVAAAGVRRKDRIDRDLDLIVLKALRKEPDRRYHSVEQFSDDLQRYLDGRPVLVAPDSRRYRAAKFVRRYRSAVAASIAGLVAILGGAGAAVYQARVAQQERVLAERRFLDVRQLTNSFLFEFHDAIADLPGSLKARQLVVKRAAEYLDGLANDAHDDVALQRELAVANERLGTILGGGGVSNLGDFRAASERYARALSIREGLAQRPTPEAADIEGLADLRVQLARFFAEMGDLTRAEDNARRAVSLLEPTLTEPGANNRRGRIATAYHQLGYVQARRDENKAALQSFEQAVEQAKRQVVIQPDDLNEIARLSRIQIDYADQLSTAGKATDSIAILREAEGSVERLLKGDPLNVRHRLSLVRVLNAQGSALYQLAEYASSIGPFTRAVAIAEDLQGAGPEDHGNNAALLISHYSLGMALIRAGQAAPGMGRLREAIAEGESILKAEPDDGWTMDELATAKLDLGETLLQGDGQRAEGCREIDGGLLLWKALSARAEIPPESAKSRDRYERLWRACQRHGTS